MAIEQCPRCGEGKLAKRVRTFTPEDACIEIKIETMRCTKFCGYKDQRDITTSVMSSNYGLPYVPALALA